MKLVWHKINTKVTQEWPSIDIRLDTAVIPECNQSYIILTLEINKIDTRMTLEILNSDTTMKL